MSHKQRSTKQHCCSCACREIKQRRGLQNKSP
jgi:hypothetical protein